MRVAVPARRFVCEYNYAHIRVIVNLLSWLEYAEYLDSYALSFGMHYSSLGPRAHLHGIITLTLAAYFPLHQAPQHGTYIPVAPSLGHAIGLSPQDGNELGLPL